MNAFLNLFKTQQAEAQPEKELPLEERQLQLQQEQLELQRRQLANQDPEFAYEQDAAKHLTADNVLEKKGLPVINGEELAGFVPKESVDYLLRKQVEPQVKTLEQQNQLLTQYAQTQQFINQTVPEFEAYVKTHYDYIINQYPGINYADLAITYSGVENDAQHRGWSDVQKLQKALALTVIQENEAKKFKLSEGDGGVVDPLGGSDTQAKVISSEDDVPDYEFIVVPDDEVWNKLDTPQNLALINFANNRMKFNDGLQKKLGKRAVVEHGTLDELQRLRRANKDRKIVVHNQLVS